MKSLYTIVAVLATVALIGSMAANLQQQASASCTFTRDGTDSCKAFKELTKDFENDVLDAAASNPNEIPGLVDTYSRDVMELFPPGQ